MKNSTLILILALVVYLCLCLFRLGETFVCMPHESGFAAWVISVVQNFGPVGVFGEIKLILFGMESMRTPFTGNANIVMQFISASLFGAGLWSLRVPYVLCSFVSLLSIFYVLRRWFDDWVGGLVVVLLAVDPVFIICTRFGSERDEIFQIFLCWSALALIELSAERHRKIFFYLSGFLFGLALWAKMLFLGYLFGAVVLFVCAGSRTRRLVAARYNLRACDFLVWALFWVAGMVPLILYNLVHTRLKTFGILFGSLVNGSSHGRNNLQLFHNIVERFEHLWLITVDVGAMKGLVLLVPFICLSVALVLAGKSRFDKRVLRGLFVVYGVCFFLSSFVPHSAYFEQLLILWPIIQILLAVSLRSLWLMLSDKFLKAVIVVVFVLYCSSLASGSVRRIHSGLNNNVAGSVHNLARALTPVRDFLDAYPEPLAVAFMSKYLFEFVYVSEDDEFKDRISLLRTGITEPTLLVLSSSALGWSYKPFIGYLGLERNEAKLLYFYDDIEFGIRFYVFLVSPRKTA